MSTERVRIGRALEVEATLAADGSVASVAIITPEDEEAPHEMRLSRHAVASVARVIATLPKGSHDTAVLMAQAWAFAALQAANALRRVEERAMRRAAAAEDVA